MENGISLDYRIHNKPPLGSTLSQLNPDHTLPHYFRRSCFGNINSDFFPLGFMTAILHASVNYSWLYCPIYRTFLNFIKLNVGLYGEDLIMRLLLPNLPYPSVTSSSGPGSSVGMATDYGLDGPRIESRWGEIFRLSRPALGPTQPPVQWVPGIFRG